MRVNIKAAAVVAALACWAGGTVSATAAPAVPAPVAGAPSPLIKVGRGDPQGYTLHRHFRWKNGNRLHRRAPRVAIPYYNGYRGWNRHRPGFRRHNGWWYPPAAFGVQIIVPRARQHHRAHGLPPEHYIWCDRRYRSYRTWDDTFQPYHGPRQLCNSPYDGR